MREEWCASGGELESLPEERDGCFSQRTADKAFSRKGLANDCIPRSPARLFLPLKSCDCELLFWLEQERLVWSFVLVSGSRHDPAIHPGRLARFARARTVEP